MSFVHCLSLRRSALVLIIAGMAVPPASGEDAPGTTDGAAGQSAILEDMHAVQAPPASVASAPSSLPSLPGIIAFTPVTSFTPVTGFVSVAPFRPTDVRTILHNINTPSAPDTADALPSNPTPAETAPTPAPPESAPAPAPPAPAPTTTDEASVLDGPGMIAAQHDGALPSDGSLPQPAASPAPTANATVNLINLMVRRGLLAQSDSIDLIKQAQDEAVAAQTTQAQALPNPGNPDGTPATAGGGNGGSNENDSVSISYIPDSVRQQMRSEIEQDVMTQARTENWAAPRTFPTWASRMTFFGDTRVRFEDMIFPHGNANDGAFFNFNSINTGSPLNNIAGTPTPFYDVDKDRDRLRLRARFGVDVALDQGFSTGLRLATGSDDNPVTENQTFGGANSGQGGNFAKYAVWLDRAFIKYQYGHDGDHAFSAQVGRFENPFMHTSMIFANDLGFDGAMVQGRYKVAQGVTPFAVAGAFPVFNTDLNFASTSPAKFTSEDKWLYAGQAGTDWKINSDYSFKGAVAFYDYETVKGKLSDPFIPLTSSDQGDTDDSRPSFAQNGNTYFPIRDIDNSTAANNFGASDQYQYYGLASGFRELAATGQLDFDHFDPFHIQLTGEAVKNLAFDQHAVNAVAVNNLNSANNFDGGDLGYMAHLLLGAPVLQKQWDWNVDLTYRYVESDSVVDGFTDADFGGVLTGTNLKGYTIGGGVALSSNIWLSLRWMSANAIAGPTYKNDLFQFDINSKF